jgi:hypothetical protein
LVGRRPRRPTNCGTRVYDWAWIALHPRAAISARPRPADHEQPAGSWSLLVRRNLTTGELAFYRCYAPTATTLAQLITVAGRRWTIEESFQAGKGLAGLDEHQVRRWTPWRRWTLLAMLAHALLAVLTAAERAHHPADAGLIELTCAEVRRLLTAALATLPAPVDTLARAADWSRWRRDHQHRAKATTATIRTQLIAVPARIAPLRPPAPDVSATRLALADRLDPAVRRPLRTTRSCLNNHRPTEARPGDERVEQPDSPAAHPRPHQPIKIGSWSDGTNQDRRWIEAEATSEQSPW